MYKIRFQTAHVYTYLHIYTQSVWKDKEFSKKISAWQF